MEQPYRLRAEVNIFRNVIGYSSRDRQVAKVYEIPIPPFIGLELGIGDINIIVKSVAILEGEPDIIITPDFEEKPTQGSRTDAEMVEAIADYLADGWYETTRGDWRMDRVD